MREWTLCHEGHEARSKFQEFKRITKARKAENPKRNLELFFGLSLFRAFVISDCSSFPVVSFVTKDPAIRPLALHADRKPPEIELEPPPQLDGIDAEVSL
jgi:hypothetical protein